MHVSPADMMPPPFYGNWGDFQKKLKFRDVPLWNVNLQNWCKFLGIAMKGIFSRNEIKPLNHSPWIINLDDLGSLGTHWAQSPAVAEKMWSILTLSGCLR